MNLRARYRRILWFFAGVILRLVWWDVFLPAVGLKKLAARSRTARLASIAMQFRRLAVQMGGVMIKMGQFLSSRLDVLPREITDELSGLQDEVLPASFDEVRPIIEKELGAALGARFVEFDPEPLAAASIGQVYRATLAPGAAGGDPLRVVVKVQRPHIDEIVRVDLSAFAVVSRWVHRYPPVRRRANVPALIQEFSQSLMEEVDYLHEGKNAETFAQNFTGRPDVRVPLVYWSHTTRRVLTLEEVQAIKITDYEAIDAAGISRPQAAQRLLDTYLKQIFEDHFFHADPHPGNLFVMPVASAGGQVGEWKLVFVDFGMTGKVPPELSTGLREVLIAFGTHDAARLVRAYQTMGVLLPSADLELIERLSGRAFERFWGKSTTEMMEFTTADAEAFVVEFGVLLREMPFQAPENFVLLARCLGILSGICSGLDKDFNIWSSIVPYAQKLITEEGNGGVRMWLKEIGGTLTTLAGLPRRTDELLRRLEQGRIETRSPELKRELGRVERGLRRLAGAVVFAACLGGAVQLYLGGVVQLAAGLAAAALLALGWALFGR